jgi:ABC-type multidrug transport system fused ATPase/permease subunit
VKLLPEGLDTLVGDRGVKLSGGEKQRVSIARALLKKADILILDEATSSLDSETEKLVQEAIDEVIRGKTAIVIAHRLSTIKNAQKIVVIDQGTCVEEGTHEELLRKEGLFHRLWQEQMFS